jgi:hypothetical protein
MRDLLDYWCRKRQCRFVPLRGDIDPAEIPRLLPWLQLYQRVEDGRFYCRLCGTALAEAYGRDPTGRYVDETVDPGWHADREGLFWRVLESGRPLRYESQLVGPGLEWKRFWRLLLPLATKAERPADLVLSIVTFRALQRVSPPDTGDVGQHVVEMSEDEYPASDIA